VPDLVDKGTQQRLGFGSTGSFGGNSNRHTTKA
jgi:hypothetical protein